MMEGVRKVIAISALLVLSVCVSAQRLVSTTLVHKGQSYAAFTSLVYYKGYFYCAFREANRHVDTSGRDNGVIRIMKSRKADAWDDFLTYQMEGTDLRDPSLTVARGKILLTTQGVVYRDGNTLSRITYTTTFKSSADSKAEFQKICFSKTGQATANDEAYSNNWLWHSYWIDGAAYGFVYLPKFAFARSTDGLHYQILGEYNLGNQPNETAVAKDRKQLIAIARGGNDNYNAKLGFYQPAENQWEWHDCGTKVGGPAIINIQGDIYVCGRSYDKEQRLTTLFRLDRQTNTLHRVLDLPSGSDCSYPGLVYRKGKLYISHYHSDDQKGSSIYLSVVEF